MATTRATTATQASTQTRIVNARAAAELTGLGERTVRRMLHDGRLKGEKTGRGDWEIGVADLPTRKGDELGDLQARMEQLAAKVERLEGENESLQRRLRALSLVNRPLDIPGGLGGAGIEGQGVDSTVYRYVPPPLVETERPFSLTVRGSQAEAKLKTRADAARWLTRHGVNSEGTPKSWPGWRDVDLTPRAVLELAISLYDPHNHRIAAAWKPVRCDDAACVCHELLPA